MRDWASLIRPAGPDDALAVARVHVRSWQVAYRTLLPDEYLDGLRPEERARRYTFCARYVDPDWWGRGIGTVLASAARARLLALGFGTAVLWLLAGNVRAERFYRRDGWLPNGRHRTEAVWGVMVDEVRYRRALKS